MPITSLGNILTRAGRTFMSAGLILLLFVGYQLWGTGVLYGQAQAGLENSLQEATELAEESEVITEVLTQTTYIETISCPEGFELQGDDVVQQCVSTTDVTEIVDVVITTEVTSSPYDNFTSEQLAEVMDLAYQPAGSAIAQIQAPDAGLNSIVVSSTDVGDLRKGPGHYSDTSLLCQSGNSAVAGHRTTYGAPFGNFGETSFSYGSEIYVHTAYGSCTYMITEKFIVNPSDTWVLSEQCVGGGYDQRNCDETIARTGTNIILTTCHPKYSAAQRLIVVAELVSSEAVYVPTQAQINELIESTTVVEEVTSIEQQEVTNTVTETADVVTDITEEVTETVVELPSTCEGASCEESADSANTVGSQEGWGEGIDGNKGALVPMLLFSLLFLSVWFIAYKVANRWADCKNDNKFKYYGYLAFALPMATTLAVAFYYIDVYLPSY